MKILHLTSRKAWLDAQDAGEYRADSLESEGFIHCSTDQQILKVANAFYRKVSVPLALWIDTDKLQHPLKWESPVGADEFEGEAFPHLYGPLNLDAVIIVTALKRNKAGAFISF